MLDTVKSIIEELPDMPFDEYYQRYIFDVQDQNIQAEVSSVKPEDVMSVNRLIDRLYHELYSLIK